MLGGEFADGSSLQLSVKFHDDCAKLVQICFTIIGVLGMLANGSTTCFSSCGWSKHIRKLHWHGSCFVRRYLQKMLSRVITPLDSFTRPAADFSCSWAQEFGVPRGDPRSLGQRLSALREPVGPVGPVGCRHSGPHGHSRADQPGQAGAGTTGAGGGSHSFQGSLCLSTVFFSGALDVWWLEIELGWWKSWCGWMQNFFKWNFEKMAANYGFGSLLFWPMIPIQIVDGLYQKFGYVWTIWFVQASVHVWVTSSRMF